MQTARRRRRRIKRNQIGGRGEMGRDDWKGNTYEEEHQENGEDSEE